MPKNTNILGIWWINMKKTDKKIFLAVFVIAAALVVLCAALWNVSDAAKSNHDGHDFPVYINEILAGNTRYPNRFGQCCDYIELYNSADYAIDLGGFQLSDGSKNKRYQFPSRTILEPDSYIVVSCDGQAGNPEYAQFGLSRSGGESIFFLTSKGVVIEKITTLETQVNQSMIVGKDGSWTVSDNPTPGLPNDASVPGGFSGQESLSPVCISEVMTVGSGYPDKFGNSYDWVELHNTSSEPVDISGFILSDNIAADKFRFPQGTLLPGDGYLVISCTDEAEGSDYAPFALSRQGGESVVLKNPEGLIVDIMDTVSTAEGQSIALDTDRAWTVTDRITPGYANTEAGWAQYQAQTGAGNHTVVITEIMASNKTALACESGEFCDWVEIMNNSADTVNLAGWYLSDQPNQPRKWAFPQISLEPGAYLVVFCSGDHSGSGLHASFSLSSGGETLALTTPGGTVSDVVTYSAVEADRSVCVDPDTGEQTVTAMFTPGYSNDPAGYEQFCAGQVPRGPLAIWEVMTSNDRFLPQSQGKCYDWVEIRNISDQDVLLSDYAVTDSSSHPALTVLPDKTLSPGEMTVVILSGDPSMSTSLYFHGDFSLNAGEDSVYLYRTDGTLTDYVLARQIPRGYSYGRQPDCGGFYFMEPTPLAENNPGARMVSGSPSASASPGVYRRESGGTVTLSASGQIYYTTDGSTPDTSSLRYDGPISIDGSTVLRAVNVEDGMLPSRVYTASFLFGQSSSLPVVSIVTDPENLWGRNGLYRNTEATKELNYPANISYAGPDGSFSVDCDLTMHGHSSLVAQGKKSFEVRFRDNYDGDLEFDLFGDGNVTTFHALILRADQESTYGSFIRDNIMSAIAIEYCPTLIAQNYKYAVLYLNGEYWGIYSIREHHSEYHYAMHMNVPENTVLIAKHYISGQPALNEIKTFCAGNDLRKPENYAYVASKLDIDSFIDWIILQSYTGNIDINGNMRYYYDSVSGLWRCGLVDLDLGMFSHQTYSTVTDCFSHDVIPNALLQNPDFRDRFLRRLSELLSGPLADEAMIARIDSMAAQLRGELPSEEARWGFPADHWESMIRSLRNYCDGRAQKMIGDACTLLRLSAQEKEQYFGGMNP